MATVERIEYDPNRTAFIALIGYADGEQSYIPAPQRLAVGDQVSAGEQVDIKPGNAMPIGNMPVNDHPQRRAEDRPRRRSPALPAPMLRSWVATRAT